MAVSLERVTLISLFVECILYGLFLSLFAISSAVLLKGRKSAKINLPMLAVSFTMLVLATIHVGIDLQRVLNGFLDPNRTAAVYLPAVDDSSFLLKSATYIFQTIIGDGFILYRVYLVWQRNRFIAFPFLLLLLGGAGIGIEILHAFSRVTPATPIFTVELQHWIITFLALTLTTNFSCTALIAGRIWWVHRTAKGRVGGPNLAAPMILVIESGAIYSFCLIILLSLYASGSFTQYILLDATTQVIGIIFSLIIVRIGLGLTADSPRSSRGNTLRPIPTHISFPGSPYSPNFPMSPTSPSVPSPGRVSSLRHSQWRLGSPPKEDGQGSPEYPMQPLEVKVTTVRTTDRVSDRRIKGEGREG